LRDHKQQNRVWAIDAAADTPTAKHDEGESAQRLGFALAHLQAVVLNRQFLQLSVQRDTLCAQSVDLAAACL
jgi:hypothetical protein